MEVTWEEKGYRMKLIYWLDNLSMEKFQEYSSDCDEIVVWYSNNMDDKIYEKYKELMRFIELDGHWKGKASSAVIDLTMSAEDILKGFSKTRRYEARRALNKDELHVEFINDYSEKEVLEYESFYNKFATKKNLTQLNVIKVISMIKENKFVIAKILDSRNEILVINGYVVDSDLKRTALFSSSSLYREKAEQSALISRANSLLHYLSMLYFKENKFLEYDLGGIYYGEETEMNKDFINVRKFKVSLGGSPVWFESGFVLPVKDIRNIENNLEKHQKELKDNKVIVWGAGKFGQYLIRRIEEENIIPFYIIDNKLADKHNEFKKQDILQNLNVDEFLILVTTSRESYEKITREDVVKEYARKAKLLYIKGEV